MLKYIDCFNSGDIKEKNCKYKNIIWHFADIRAMYKNNFNNNPIQHLKEINWYQAPVKKKLNEFLKK